MQAALLIIGDEILSGNVQDTNSSHIAKLLFENNISLGQTLVVADTEAAIKQGIAFLFQKADLIVSSGGLGPTKDDVTKNAIVSYFGAKLVFNDTVFQNLETRYASLRRPLNALNRDQAMVPDIGETIPNDVGTAPVFWIEKEGKTLATLPGVPSEMHYLFANDLLPRIVKKFASGNYIARTILQVIGIPESDLAMKLEETENQIEAACTDSEHYKLAYLPAMGTIRLQIIGSGHDRASIDAHIAHFKEQILAQAGQYVFAEGDTSIAAHIGHILKAQNATLSIAESCTGGYLSHLITSVAGSSDYYIGSVVSYANALKTNELNVSEDIIKQFGAVSEQTCHEMVKGCLAKFGTTYAVAVTGIAGPGGDEGGKPVGTVWVGVGSQDKAHVQQYRFNRNRTENIHLFAVSALDMLRKLVEGEG